MTYVDDESNAALSSFARSWDVGSFRPIERMTDRQYEGALQRMASAKKLGARKRRFALGRVLSQVMRKHGLSAGLKVMYPPRAIESLFYSSPLFGLVPRGAA